MKYWYVLSLCTLSIFSAFTLQQDAFSVPIVDKSGAGTPFEVSGKLTLRESVRANELEWSWGEKVVIKNVSGMAILLFVATITEIGRHSAPVSRRPALGDGATYQLEDDRFFSEKLLEPGEAIVLRDTKPGIPDVACCVNQLAETHDPVAEVRVHFVQFADGSVFGDPAEARDSLAIRQTILHGLHALLQRYEQSGESSFAAKLSELRSYQEAPSLAPKAEEQVPFFQTTVFRRIIAKYDEGGSSGAIREARDILKTADRHGEAMNSLHPSSGASGTGAK